MEEVDKIILSSLSDCGCDFADGMSSLAQLSTENVVEAAVRCLRIIQTDLKLSHVLPPGMSARFRVGTALAQACQSAGYRGDIGYQTFLYSSETDVRKVFMFLVEKLPRKKDESSEQTTGSALQQNIARVLKAQLSLMWLPSYCKTNGIRWTQSEFFIEGSKGQVQFHYEPLIIPQHVGHATTPPSRDLLEYYKKKLPFVDTQLSDSKYLMSSLMEHNALELSRQQEWDNILNTGTIGARISPQECMKRQLSKLEDAVTSGENAIVSRSVPDDGPRLGGISLNSSFDQVVNMLSNQSLGADTPVTIDIVTETNDVNSNKVDSVRNESGTKRSEASNDPEKISDVIDAADVGAEEKSNEVLEDMEQVPEETEEETICRVEKELKIEVRETVEKLEKMEMDIHNFQETIIKAKEEQRTCEISNKAVQEKVKLQKKTLQLLPEAEQNMAKLQELVNVNKQKMIGLEQQWEKHRTPLQEKYERLKQEFSQKETQSERKMKEVKLVRQRIKENTEEMKRKEQMEKQLTAQCAEVTVDIPRKSYTKRIFEIVANIRKQKQEIERVLIDVRTLQKEINQLEGRAERTFTAADDLFYKDAASNNNVRQVYKYLVSLNVNCSQLLDTVEQTGEVMREIRNLEEQVADESKKNTSRNLEKITEDFKAMKKENVEMMKKIKAVADPSPKHRKK